jgi:hypothetical protein
MEETDTPQPHAGEDSWEKLNEYIPDVPPIPGDELPRSRCPQAVNSPTNAFGIHHCQAILRARSSEEARCSTSVATP